MTSLFVRDFAIVRRLDLELNPGLSVLTGETGAGKSIVVDALALALGARGEAANIRHGADSAEVVAAFGIGAKSDAVRWLEQHDLTDGDNCITRRIIYHSRPTKGFINDRPVTVQALRQLGELLVDIHGQHEHQSLLKREAQRQVLDDYAEISTDVRALAAVYEKHRRMQARLESLTMETDERRARLELLRYQVDELEKLEPSPTEFKDLEQEHSRLAHANELLQVMRATADALYDADDNAIGEILSQYIQRLDPLVEYDPELSAVTSLMNEALVHIEEAATQLHLRLDRVELDPQRLDWVDQRLSALLDVGRKHQCQPDELTQVMQRLGMELADIENADTDLTQLRSDIDEAGAAYRSLAGDISTARHAGGKRLAAAVTAEMQGLGMTGGVFDIEINDLTGDTPSRFGYDAVEFNVSANPGQPLKPISKVASGGELSRISLALQVVVAGKGRIPCLVFDEVDVGIGGGVAEVVGQKLKRLGLDRQVLCVTHLAQVAAQGHHHYRVHKINNDGVQIKVTAVGDDEREQELARMLGGVDITAQTLAHAREMLGRAGS